MANVLVISSFVASGTVGLQAAVPALQAQGHCAMQLPTILLSNHSRYRHMARTDISISALRDMLSALDGNGWLSSIDVVLSGYLPDEGHAVFVRDAARLVRERAQHALYICDPVIGDDPSGIYVPVRTAENIREQLIPLADVITPNRFELAWLSGHPVVDAASAGKAARRIGCAHTTATSIPHGPDLLATILFTARAEKVMAAKRLPSVPHGTGDLFAGLLAGNLASGQPVQDAFEAACAALTSVIVRSAGQKKLELSALTVLSEPP